MTNPLEATFYARMTEAGLTPSGNVEQDLLRLMVEAQREYADIRLSEVCDLRAEIRLLKDENESLRSQQRKSSVVRENILTFLRKKREEVNETRQKLKLIEPKGVLKKNKKHICRIVGMSEYGFTSQPAQYSVRCETCAKDLGVSKDPDAMIRTHVAHSRQRKVQEVFDVTDDD